MVGPDRRQIVANSSWCLKILPAFLSVVGGAADVTSFLTFGMFNAHITGNLVILAAHIVARDSADISLILSVPVFILVLILSRLLAVGFESLRIGCLIPLLLLQFLLLAGLFAICGTSASLPDPHKMSVIVAGQLGVAAMAAQTALVQLSLRGAASTAVMTTNVTRFIMDAGDVLLRHPSADVTEARRRAGITWPVIVGFIVGACLGAACFAVAGTRCLALPAGLALFALLMGLRVVLKTGNFARP